MAPRRVWHLPRALALAALFLAIPNAARADRSPGPLSSAHKAQDGADRCNLCHTDGKNLANDKCLGCHDHQGLARRIAERRGFHASEKAAGKPCYLCHTEHKGESKDISGFGAIGGRERFDHAWTGWPLAGAHQSVKCEKCHESRSFSAARPACDSCHRSPHGDLRPPLRRCERCHSDRNWEPLARLDFDHDKDARFPLQSKHAGVPCAKCHTKAVYRASAALPDCTPCHTSPHTDPMFSRRRCDTCHGADDAWSRSRFDHAKQARFPLEGQHARAACAACHKPQGKAKLARACESCHPDPHAGRFPRKLACDGCHTAKAWASEFKFDHKRQAGFPLAGKHGQVACRACHRGASPAEFERFEGIVLGPGRVACMSCHRHEDVHKKQFKDEECLRCHVGAGKKQFKAEAVEGFHGPGSRFPLVEAHESVACEQCHKSGAYQGTPTQCGPACHKDPHKAALGPDCARCHDGAHWQATRFDHDDTDYPLVGHHADVPCELCHKAGAFKPTPRACGECHARDDAHQGTVGKDCGRCHTPSGRSTFNHNDPAYPDRFRVEGKHQEVACRRCHPTTVFGSTKPACESCHAEPAQHKGELGTRCGDCHDVSGWRDLRRGLAAHDTGTFHFGGAHDRLRCARCHTAGRPLRGTAELCIACHRGDDIHHNALGPRCGDCHAQESWSGSQVRFFHERVGCDLRGLHRALPCADCHAGGNFNALAPTCLACHRGDSIRAARDNPKAGPAHAAFTQCATCHNANYFVPARPGGGESVCQ